jgi:hypothetical protein
MTLLEQVCTFEQAKKLRKLGDNIDSIWSWVTPYCLNLDNSNINHYPYSDGDEEEEKIAAWLLQNAESRFPAYTVAELGELLIANGCEKMPIPFGADAANNWRHLFLATEKADKYGNKYIYYPTEAQARAALLIHILENKQ